MKPRNYHPLKIKKQKKTKRKLVAVLTKDTFAPGPVPPLLN